jgi:hypothetical protein
MRFEGNETADCIARQATLHPLIGPEPAFGISARVARGTGQVGSTSSIDSPFMNKSRLRVFLKDPLLKGVENCSV